MARKGTRYRYSSPLTRHNQGQRRFKKVQKGQSRSMKVKGERSIRNMAVDKGLAG